MGCKIWDTGTGTGTPAYPHHLWYFASRFEACGLTSLRCYNSSYYFSHTSYHKSQITHHTSTRQTLHTFSTPRCTLCQASSYPVVDSSGHVVVQLATPTILAPPGTRARRRHSAREWADLGRSPLLRTAEPRTHSPCSSDLGARHHH